MIENDKLAAKQSSAPTRKKLAWYRLDLHLHTPASADYQEPEVTYLDILRQAEVCGLDVIAFTDHNTVEGINTLRREIKELELLESLQRIRDAEARRLAEYRRLLGKIVLLPGFEFTATLGFHVLGIFPPDTTVRELEHILLKLNVPPEMLDQGSTEVGATVDVLTAYRVINAAGGLVIAAHANASHGVAMQDFDFGGQTKIAYTQDPNLHALEVTDLESKGRRTTAHFYNGSKPEYPRRMHCIQGSDAHRLRRDPNDKNRLGIGDRATEVQLKAPTFENIMGLFLGSNFSHTRPYRFEEAPYDHVLAARQQGPNLVQSFHEFAQRRDGYLHAIMCDICAFANTNGGTAYIGLSGDTSTPIYGLDDAEEAASLIRAEVGKKIMPPLDVQIEHYFTEGKQVLEIAVPIGDNPPYVIDEHKIYVRDEAESNLAVRDEIVALVKRSLYRISYDSDGDMSSFHNGRFPKPKTGVEIVFKGSRKGENYYSLQDLRNGNIVHNVTQKSARKLWQYALTEYETNPVDPNRVKWQGDIGLWKRQQRGGQVRYDLAQRTPNNKIRVYYGVTEEGLHGLWQQLIDSAEESSS